MNVTRLRARTFLAGLTNAALVGLVCAQGGEAPPVPQGQGNEQPSFPGSGLGVDAQGRPLQTPRVVVPQQAQDPEKPQDPLDPIWARPLQQPTFRGFPSFTSPLFGAYPRQGLAPGGREGLVPELPTAEPLTGWPSWVTARNKEPLPHSPELALLVRHSDRVWRRVDADDAFTPLYHYDKLDTLGPGAEVEVRQTGEFEVLFEDSGRLASSGPVALRIAKMTLTEVSVEVGWFTRLRLIGVGREHRVRLPDGTLLVLPADPAEGPPPGQAIVVLERLAEPDQRPGRATVFQGGDRPVRLIPPGGGAEIVLASGQTVTLLLKPRHEGQAASGALDAGGIVPVTRGGVLEFVGRADSAVRWSGATFRPAAGQTLRLDPLQGQPFSGAPGAR